MFDMNLALREQFRFSPLRTGLFLSALLGLSIAALANQAEHVRGQFTVFDAPNATDMLALSINDLGEVTGYVDDGPFGGPRHLRGFVRDADGHFTVFDAAPDATTTFPFETNVRGETVGNVWTEGGSSMSGFIRNRHGEITPVKVPNSLWTNASAINDRGDVAGSWGTPSSDSYGFVRDCRGNITVFSIPNNGLNKEGMNVHGITSRGDIVGDYYAWNIGKKRIFVRDWKGGFTFFDTPDGDPTTEVMNDRGEIAGVYIVQASTVFGFVLERNGELVNLGLPGVSVGGINFGGEVAGSFADATPGGEKGGFIWDPKGNIKILNAPNASVTTVNGINDRGDVTGMFSDSSQGNKGRGFIFRQHEERK